jgi:hypothetical protein
MLLKTNTLALISTTMLAAGMVAQTAPESAPGPVTAGMLPLRGGVIAMRVEDLDTPAVKGAPFCATITTEHTQSFADGNRIHTSDNSTTCRDSEGRTHREAGLNLLGAGPHASAPRLITIVDSVAGVRYMLDPDNKIAHKMALPVPGAASEGSTGLPEKGKRVMINQNAGSSEPHGLSTNVFFHKFESGPSESAPTTQNLGDQTINGIHATGTRLTTTIPSGQMGNDKPISVTSEQWYSSDLKATVMTKHSDPWAGELKTEFISVNTSEPDPSLFTVPSDYKIVDDKAGPYRIQISSPDPPAQ